MLNMKFAEAMELTEDELMEVSGGMNTLVDYTGGWGGRGIYPGWAGQGMSPQPGAFSWLNQIGDYFNRRRP